METKIHINHRFMDDQYEIWMFDRTPSGNQVFYPVEGGGWRVEHVEHSAAIPNQPTLTFSRGMLEAFIEATRHIIPASEATQAHLADAIKIRDRLLDLLTAPGIVLDRPKERA